MDITVNGDGNVFSEARRIRDAIERAEPKDRIVGYHKGHCGGKVKRTYRWVSEPIPTANRILGPASVRQRGGHWASKLVCQECGAVIDDGKFVRKIPEQRPGLEGGRQCRKKPNRRES